MQQTMVTLTIDQTVPYKAASVSSYRRDLFLWCSATVDEVTAEPPLPTSKPLEVHEAGCSH